MTPEEMRDRLSELGVESEFVSYPNKKAIGVKWQIDGIVWKYDWYGSTPQALSTYMHYSPKQAIAATVGVGTCKRIYHPNRITRNYTCSNCGYGASDERWAYCPKCGHKYVHGEVEEWWKSVGRKVAE